MKNFFINLMLRFLPCAFDATNMNRIQGGTVTIWAYKSADTAITQAGSGYFDAHVELLRQGDVIHAVETGVGVATLTVTSADNVTPVTTA